MWSAFISCMQADGSFVNSSGVSPDGELVIETDVAESSMCRRDGLPLRSAPHQLKSIFHQQQYGKVPRFTYRPSWEIICSLWCKAIPSMHFSART